MKSRLGAIFAGAYLVLSVYLLITQGIFGESFIAIILGMPWSMLLAAFEFGGVSGIFLYVLVLGPIVLNAYLLYLIGKFIGCRIRRA